MIVRAIAMLAVAATGGLAVAPAPALAQLAVAPPATSTLPAQPQDFTCYILLRDRRIDFTNRPGIDATARATLVNNSTIVSAYFAGRLSHYPASEAAANWRSADQRIAVMNAQQREDVSAQCANIYLTVSGAFDRIEAQADSGQ